MMKQAIVAGQNDIAVNCLEIMLNTPDIEVMGVLLNKGDTGQDDWQKSLKKSAMRNLLHIFKIDDINNAHGFSTLSTLEPDLFFSFQYDQILQKHVIDIFDTCVNLHFAPLPKYRGVAPIAHALINGEEEFGVTMHLIDEGIDTGDIISQKLFAILESDTGRSLYEKCIKQGVQLFKETLPSLIYGTYITMPQDSQEASYYDSNSIDFSQNKIDWNKPTKQLYNWVRAFIFPPFQYPYTIYENKKVEVAEAFPFYIGGKESPGTIVDINQAFIKVATNDGYICLIKMNDNGYKLNAKVYAKEYGLSVGGQFEQPYREYDPCDFCYFRVKDECEGYDPNCLAFSKEELSGKIR